MDIALSDQQAFVELFTGRSDAFGTFTLSGTKDTNGKATGKATTLNCPVTQDIYIRHLKGVTPLGIIPIKNDSTCSFAVIDIDDYSKPLQSRVLKLIKKLNLPLCPFRSKSGGLHLYLFLKEPVQAKRAREFLAKTAQFLGLKSDTEIFPKQIHAEEGKVGNWINLPLFNAFNETERYMYDIDGQPIQSMAVTISQCQMRRVSGKDLNAFFDILPLSDAPPCLQRCYIGGNISNRNNYLFAFGTYLKAKHGPDSYRDELIAANAAMDKPLAEQELMSTIIASLDKTDYRYICDQEPLSSRCDSLECQQRKFGVGGKEISTFTFGEFRMIMTDPPTYEWDVNGVTMKFLSEDELISQTAFHRLSMRQHGFLPNKIKEVAWRNILNRAMRNKVVVNVDLTNDVSVGAILMSYVTEYLAKKYAPDASPDVVLRGGVYGDIKTSSLIFDVTKLVSYLIAKKGMKPASVSAELPDRLKKLGATAIRYNVRDDLSIPCYSMPMSSVDLRRYTDGGSDDDFLSECANIGALTV